MLELGLVLVSGTLFFLSACVLGANNVAVAFGPAIGAKVLSYKVAAPMAAVCAALGVILFGVRDVPIYGGYLTNWEVLQDFPEMAQEALLWPQVTLIAWQSISLYYRVPEVHHLGVAAGLAGVAIVYPGGGHINWGETSATLPYISGYGTAYLPALLVPLLTVIIVPIIFLPIRSLLLRTEDPFYKVVWVLSIIGAATATVNVCYIFYALTYISHWRFNHLSPQGIVVVLCACSIYGCVSTWFGIPYIVKYASLKARLADPVKRASLLGLDDDLVSLLNHKAYGTGLRAKMACLYQKLFDKDIIAFIRHDPNVLRIHNGGEEFHKAAEDCFGLMQICVFAASCLASAICISCYVVTLVLLSMGHGAVTFNRAVGTFASILHIGQTYSVTASAPVPLELRFIGAAGIAISILLLGWRLVPVAGVQIVKMSPFRSYVVTTASAVTACVVYPLGLGAGGPTYINITAVVAVGLVEGTTHVNWPKVGQILKWWLGTLIPLFLITALLFGQGSAPPSQSNLQELAMTNATLSASIKQLSVMDVSASTLKASTADIQQLTVLVKQVATDLQSAVQQAVTVYTASQGRCRLSS